MTFTHCSIDMEKWSTFSSLEIAGNIDIESILRELDGCSVKCDLKRDVRILFEDGSRLVIYLQYF